ncbi:MAG: hypothetical protein LQ338_004944 [Usnochroma carphineum]|nr:MAG: hypothetical protein LQ338_004944 [Usnochroma carphineum]
MSSTNTTDDNGKPHPNPHAPPKDPRRPPIARSKSHPAPYSSAVKPGEATAAYKQAQSMLAKRAATPQGQKSEGKASKASSQACESGEVSESERGVMRKDRKDVSHEGPGPEEWEGNQKFKSCWP